MKNALLMMLLALLVSCSGNISDTNSDDNNNDSIVEVSTFEAPEAPPVTQERLEVEKQASVSSPFLSEGCCNDESTRVDDCCCDAVLAKYAKMREEEDPNIGEYKMTDPILGKCKKKMQQDFDLIDNPPTAVVSDEDPYGGDF